VVAGDSSAQPGGVPAGFVPGSRVAGYLLERLVGAGGTAAVFRARDERLGRVVALKLLALELSRDEGFRRRFLREARAVAAVDHPHIIPIYEAGEADGVLFIAMRFVAGSDLRAIIGREGGLAVERAAALLSPVASALDAAHAAGLVHRDVKPANMLVDSAPGRPEHVYLSDFGLARGVLSSSGLTRAGQFLGTPDYAAPEQIAGRTVDGRADQYGLACVAYTLLAGTVPYERDQAMAALYAHLFEPPPRITAVRPDLPAAADRVLAKALAKAPEDRYDTCRAFAEALRQALGLGSYGPAWLGLPGGGPDYGPPPFVNERPDGSRALESTVPASDAPSAPAGSVGTATLTATPDTSGAAGAVREAGPEPDRLSEPTSSDPEIPALTQTWTAVVTADREYYDRVQSATTPEAAQIGFPDQYPERRFRLSGPEARIGRRSTSRHTEPEIDLKGPPGDPGVSRLHAKLVARPDGGWSVIDLGSPNGTLVNGREITANEPVPLRDGDRISLGIWTMITLTREAGE